MKTIFELHQAIEVQPRKARALLDAFVAGNSFPLIERDTATFFFWDGKAADGVNLMHWVFGLETRQPFLRLGDTDAFYLPVELPHKARVEYKLELVRRGRTSWIRDPHNDRLAFDPFGANSVCPMSGYTHPEWVTRQEGCRTGQVVSFELPSDVYGDTRTVEVYLPSEYKPYKAYPLLICHDGRDYQRFTDIIAVLDNLIHRNEVAPLVVAFTNGVERNVEYGANPKQAKFLVEELLPALRNRYGVSRDPDETGLMGASFGGVSSLFAAWTYPGTFGKLFLQSGSFVWADIGHHGRGPLFDPVAAFVKQLREDPERVRARMFLSCGHFESLIWFNRGLVPILRDAGNAVRFVEAQDGHNWINWRDRLRDGLSWLYPGALWMTYD